MVLEQKKQTQIEQIGNIEHTDFTISTANTQVIMDLLSKGFYQNPIESIVRELCSNSWDSHVEAECEDQAIVVKFSKIEGVGYIEFIDFGVGLSPERVKTVFTVYFESDKRDSNNQIGGFGLGSKSPYAYTDSFFVTTRFDGIEYQYLMSKNEYGISRLSLLASFATEESNGTSIKLPLKKEKTRDYYGYGPNFDSFYSACKIQLAYFNNVFIEGNGCVSTTEFNDSTIHHYNHFVFSTLVPHNEVHIKLGQCFYKIAWSEINRSRVSIPIALKFEIGELMPTPNREGIILDDVSKQLITTRLKLAVEEIRELYESQRGPVTDWKIWLKKILKIGNYDRYELILGDTKVILDNSVVIGKDVELGQVSSDINMTRFLNNWSYSRKINKILARPEKHFVFIPRHVISHATRLMTINKDYQKYTNKYIAEVLYPNTTIYILRRSKMNLYSYRVLLNLHGHHKSEWRTRIIEYQKFEDEIWSSFENYDSIQVPQDWIKSQYKKRDKRDLSGKAIVYQARFPSKSTDSYATFDKRVYKHSDLAQTRAIVIYGKKEDSELLAQVYVVTSRLKNVKVVYMSEANYKVVEGFDQFMHVSEFEKHNRYFAKSITGWMLYKFKEENPLFFNSPNYFITLKHSIVEDLNYVANYAYSYYQEHYSRNMPEDYYKACWEIAKEHKYYDHEAIAVFRRVWDFIDKARDLQYLKGADKNRLDLDTVDIARKLLKNKIILDLKQ